MNNLEVKVVAYNKLEKFTLNQYEHLEELTESIVKDYEAGKLDDGSQYYVFDNETFIIDVDKELEEVTIVDKLYT